MLIIHVILCYDLSLWTLNDFMAQNSVHRCLDINDISFLPNLMQVWFYEHWPFLRKLLNYGCIQNPPSHIILPPVRKDCGYDYQGCGICLSLTACGNCLFCLSFIYLDSFSSASSCLYFSHSFKFLIWSQISFYFLSSPNLLNIISLSYYSCQF